jgi:hypothetical protein
LKTQQFWNRLEFDLVAGTPWTPHHDFAVPKSLTQSLIVGSVAFEEAGIHRVTPRADPARARHGISGGVGSHGKRQKNASPLGAVAACSQGPRPLKISGRKIMARYSGLPQIELKVHSKNAGSAMSAVPRPQFNDRCEAR